MNKKKNNGKPDAHTEGEGATIQVLSPQVANMIAAGEVVERPSSVVKELLENAIDAEATAITVEIRGGGISYLRISDNGKGIASHQLATAFLRHATSKLQEAKHLEDIATLGFRGEALAAISAVSKIKVTSRVQGEEFATFLQLEGGKVVETETTGGAEGTTMVVEDLFFNTPARKKFLKAEKSEGAAIASLVQVVALSHPDIAVKFIREGKTELTTGGEGVLKTTIFHTLGKDIALGMREVCFSDLTTTLEGYVCLPSCCRGSRNMQHFFVNGRYIKSPLLCSALEGAYENMKMVGKFPSAVLHLTVDYRDVDVNVHPAKTQIKFAREQEIFRILYHGVLQALGEFRDIQKGVLEDTTAPHKKPLSLQKNSISVTPHNSQVVFTKESSSVLGEVNQRAKGLASEGETSTFVQENVPMMPPSSSQEATTLELRTSRQTQDKEKPLDKQVFLLQSITGERTITESKADSPQAPLSSLFADIPQAPQTPSSLGFEDDYDDDDEDTQWDNEDEETDWTEDEEEEEEEEEEDKQEVSETRENTESYQNTSGRKDVKNTERIDDEAPLLQHKGLPDTREGGKQRPLIPVATTKGEEEIEITTEEAEKADFRQRVDLPIQAEDWANQKRLQEQWEAQETQASLLELDQVEWDNDKSLQQWRVVGEVFRTYIMVEVGDEVFFIDKHAAHERARFNKLKEEKYRPMAQPMLEPVVLHLSPEEMECIQREQETLEEFSFHWKQQEDDSIAVDTAPHDMPPQEVEETLLGLVDKLANGEMLNPDATRDHLLHSIACKAAIKAGYVTYQEELEAVAKLAMEEQVRHCPHGRPILASLCKKDLEKKFKRIL